MKRILVTGGDGLLAHALAKAVPKDVELIRLGKTEFDVTESDGMARVLDRLRPAVVINTAAYNAVDRCEVERDLSWAINAAGPERLARLCAERGIRLVHYGTDYVFDGKKLAPYTEDDAPNPLNHYAAGKLAGERAVLAASSNHLVLRTSWLFGANPARPQRSYVHAILRQALDHKPIRATTDQVSVPTFAGDLARWTFEFVERRATGLFHAVSGDGLSRFDWTKEILAAAHKAGLLSSAPSVEPVTTAFFNPAIRRSAYSVMSNAKASVFLGRALGSWRGGLGWLLHNPLWPGG